MAHNSKLLCLPFYRGPRLLQGFGTERKSRENVTLKIITNVKEIQFRDSIKGSETHDFWRFLIHTICYFVGHNSWIYVTRKISSVSSKCAIVHCCTLWIYLLNESSPKLTRESVTRKISSVSSKCAIVHCCTLWIYLLNESSPKLTRETVTLHR